MPAQTAAYLNDVHARTGNGFHIPNNGAHWVDWAPPKKRERVEQAFDDWMTSGTRKKKAKTKTPFLRVNRADKFEALHQRLLGAAMKERDTLTRMYEAAMQGVKHREAALAEMGVTPTPDANALHLRLAKRVNKAQRAVSTLTRWTREDGALPRTWHGVLPKE
jgi:hypothetical protein